MTLKTRLLVAALVLAGASGAQALTTDLGPLGNVAFQHSNIAPGAFSDTWTFQIASESDVGASVTNVAALLANTYGITGFAGMLAGTPLTFSSQDFGALPSGIKVTVGAGLVSALGAGSYDLTLTGNASAAGASYAGNLIATPVPEPQIYAMLLAGLGAIGFVTRRRTRR